MKSTQIRPQINALLDNEKELKDLVTLCSQEIGLLLGVLQGELLCMQKSPKVFPLPNTLADLRGIGERIHLLARDLKVFSHTSALDAELSDLSQVLLESVDATEKELQVKRVHLTVLAEAGTYCKIDSSALGTALTNLILFAGQFLPEKSELHVTLKHTSSEIRVEISESSSANIPHFEDHLFHPHALRELHPSLSSLCVAPSVAKFAFLNHGGSFEVSSSTHGKTYLMTLPYNAALAPTLSYPKQRKAKRIRTHLLGMMTGQFQNSANVVVSVISTLGAFLKLPKNAHTEAPVLNQEISFSLHLTGGNKIAEVRAKIANLHAAEDYYGLGLEFMEVEAKGKLLIEEIIRHSLT